MLKSLLNEQEVTFPNVPPRQVLQQLVDRLNSEKNTNDYEFIVDDQSDVNGTRINLGYMKLIMLKKLKFEKNELIDDYQLSNLNKILSNIKQTEKHEVLFVFENENNLRVSIIQQSPTTNRCNRRPIIIKLDMATEIFKQIYEYLADNPILFIIEQLKYWAVVYQGLDDFSYEELAKSEFVEHALLKAQRDFAELKLVIEAANI
jgi:hypothetical protein